MRFRSDSGAASLEATIIGVVLIVPVIWLLAILAEMHRAALATDAAVREVGWEVTHGGTEASVDAAAAAAFADHGLDANLGRVRWEGSTDRGDVVVVTASFPVRVASFPLIGALLSEPTIEVAAVHRASVPRFRSES